MFFWQISLFFFLLEAFFLFWAMGTFGFFHVFLYLLLTALCGGFLIQRQGLSMLVYVQNSFEKRAVPVDNLFGGICTVIAGLLLIIPGFLTDIAAALLLIPAFRRFIKDRVLGWAGIRTTSSDEIIEGSYVRVEETVDLLGKDYDDPSGKPPDA